MTCDHGIRFDAFCADCESGDWGEIHTGWAEVEATRRRAGIAAAACLLLALALVAVPVVLAVRRG